MNFLHPQSRALLLLMSAMVAIGPLSTDMYLPAWPAIARDFGTSAAAVQLTISAYLAGFAAFHLLCGPLADRYGRRPVLIGGASLFFLSCVACALARDVEQLIVFRFLQGIGACTAPTLARAMIRDIYGPQRAARALAYLAAIMAIAPVVAPVLGGWMLGWWSWTSMFWFQAAYGLLAGLAVARLLPETLTVKQSLHPRGIARNYRQLLVHRRFLLAVAAMSAHYAGAFAFISGSSFVLIEMMGVAEQHFGLWFMLIVFGYISGSYVTGRHAHRVQARSLMLAGAAAGLLAGVAMVALTLAGILHPLAMVLPMALYTASVGIAMPHAMSAALAPFPDMAGTASSLLGFIQMSISALVGIAVGSALSDSPLPMALIIATCAGIAVLLFAILRGQGREKAEL